MPPFPLCDSLTENRADLASIDRGWLESELNSLIEEAKVRWPGVELNDTDFMHYVSERLPKEKATKKIFEEFRISELYLAFGCALNDSAALSHFDEEIIGSISGVLSRFSKSTAFHDEVRQALRQKLLLPSKGKGPRIIEYSGKGPLRKWVQVAALRIAISLQRIAKPEVAIEDAMISTPSPDDNVELKLLRARYQSEFSTAIQQAFDRISSKERNVLRLCLVDGLTLQQVGNHYGVHRTTVSAWVSSARQKVIDETRQILCDRLNLARPEFESLFAAVRSGLHVSLIRLLNDKNP